MLAFSEESVRAALRRQRISLLSIRDTGATTPPRLGAHELTVFTRQLGGLLQAGMPLLNSLELVADTHPRRRISAAATVASHRIANGIPLSCALADMAQQSDAAYGHHLAVGEASGTLGAVLQRLAAERERQAAQTRRLANALTYPCTVLLMSVLLAAAMMLWVIPTFKQIFEDFGAKLPAPTRTVIMISDASLLYGPPAIVGLAALALATALLRRRSKTACEVLDRMLLRLPVAGPLASQFAIARWCRALGALTRSGIALPDALGAAAAASGNACFRRASEEIMRRLKRGQTLAEAMRACRRFPPDIVQPIEVAEHCATLDAMLEDMATRVDMQIDSSLGTLSRVAEPVIVIVVGAVVGMLVTALYLPVIELGNVI